MVSDSIRGEVRVIPLSKPCFGREEEMAAAEVLRSGWVAQGPTTGAFECDFAGITGARQAIATSSCTTALHLAIVAAGLGPGDEVILPSFTFPATANAVLYEGADPILVDIDPKTLNIDVDQVRRAISKNTKAVIGVHLFGFPCPIIELEALCREHGLFLIEDAACAIGTEIEGRPAGGFGNIACFSLHGRKVVTCGEGGVLTTNDDDLATRLRSLRTHGASAMAESRRGADTAAVEYTDVGYNYRISDVQSAIARVQLTRLPTFLQERDELARRYDETLHDLPIQLPPRNKNARHSFQSYVIVLQSGDPVQFRNELATRGVQTRVGTYAVHEQPYFPRRLLKGRDLPASSGAATRSVAIPLFNGLSEADQWTVIEAVRDACAVVAK